MNEGAKSANDRIIVAVDDMFFAAKILTTAQNLGRQVERVKTPEQLIEALKQGAPALLIVDLNSPHFQSLEAIAALKSQAALSGMRILGFLSHVQVELKRRAEDAGFDIVIPR